jgi:hypothetical protein
MIFVYDGNPGHEWQSLLGDHVVLERSGNQLEGGNPEEGDILVCHRVQSESVERQLRSFADAGVIVVEVGADTAETRPAEGNYYRRAKGVAVIDAHFTTCFRFFREQLQRPGMPAWQLLEGPPPPDALLAYHLLDLLRGDNAADRAREALVDDARKEAQTIAAAEGIPTLAAIDDPVQRREFLRTCS